MKGQPKKKKNQIEILCKQYKRAKKKTNKNRNIQ